VAQSHFKTDGILVAATALLSDEFLFLFLDNGKRKAVSDLGDQHTVSLPFPVAQVVGLAEGLLLERQNDDQDTE
jgi:hypothetical protein